MRKALGHAETPLEGPKCPLSSGKQANTAANQAVKKKIIGQTKTSYLRQKLATCGSQHDGTPPLMKTDGKQKHNVAVPLHHVKQATPSTESLCKRKKLLKDKDDKACLKKTRNPASKTSLEEVSHPPKVIPHTAIANEILVSKTCDNASKKPSPNVCHRPGSCSSQNQPSANVLTSSCDYLDVPPSDSTGVQESESQNNNTSSENDSQKLTSAHETVNSSTGDVQEIEPAVSVVASPVRRPVRGRSQKPNPKSDSELYSNARLKAILEVLRSNLTAEEKLRAIKQSHDHWEKHDRVNLMSDPARKITGTDMVEPHEHILPKSDSLHDLNFSDFKPDTLQKNLKSDISCTVTSPKDQVEEVSESTFNSSPQPKRAVLTSDSIQDGTCSEQLLSPKHAKKSDRLETESSSCLSAVPTVTCTTLLTPTVSSECFLDSEFQDSKPTCDPWACESNDNRKFLKLDTKLFAPDNGVSPPKSPLTVQEWVDSLERPSCLETQNEENAFSNTESKEDGDCSGQTESGISFPSSDLTAEDNLKLGAEAYNLEDSQHEDLAPRKSDSLNGAETSSTPNRISLSELRTKQSSFNSETSGFSTVSSISSIESLLDARREDPEEILFALGFGGRPSDDPLKRIPVRFLSQPSVAAGIDIDSFIRNQEELQQKDFSGLGYLGLSAYARKHATLPQSITSKILQKLGETERQRKTSTYSCISLPEFATVVRVATAFRSGKMRNSSESILDPANREFLEKQGKENTSDRPKKLIIGKLAYSFDQEGDLLQNSPEAIVSQNNNDLKGSIMETQGAMSTLEEDDEERQKTLSLDMNANANMYFPIRDGKESSDAPPASNSTQKENASPSVRKKAPFMRQSRIAASGNDEALDENYPFTFQDKPCHHARYHHSHSVPAELPCSSLQIQQGKGSAQSGHIPSNQSESSGFADEMSSLEVATDMQGISSSNQVSVRAKTKPLLQRANSDTLLDQIQKGSLELSANESANKFLKGHYCLHGYPLLSLPSEMTKSIQVMSKCNTCNSRHTGSSCRLCASHSCHAHDICPAALLSDEVKNLKEEVRSLSSSVSSLKRHPSLIQDSSVTDVLSQHSSKALIISDSSLNGGVEQTSRHISLCASHDRTVIERKIKCSDAGCQVDLSSGGQEAAGMLDCKAKETNKMYSPKNADEADSGGNSSGTESKVLPSDVLLPDFHILQLLSTQTLIELHNLRLALEYYKIQGRQMTTAVRSYHPSISMWTVEERESLQSLTQLRKDICAEVMRMEELIAQRLCALQSDEQEGCTEEDESAVYFTAVSKRIVELLREQSVICQKLHEIVRNEVSLNETALCDPTAVVGPALISRTEVRMLMQRMATELKENILKEVNSLIHRDVTTSVNSSEESHV